MSDLKRLKKVYDKLNNDNLRSRLLKTADMLHFRKDIIRMDTNNICNVHCIMCSSPRDTSVKFLALTDFAKIMDTFGKRTRMLYLSCSYEPLLTPDFHEYVRCAKAKGIPHVSICTNGLLLNQKTIADLIESGTDEIIVSFNGFCREDYERIMKGSDFHKVCDNIKNLQAYKKQHGRTKPALRINTMLLKSNLLRFDTMLSFWNKHSIDSIQFREVVQTAPSCDKNELQKELLRSLEEKEYNKIMTQFQALILDKAPSIEIILPKGILEKPRQENRSFIGVKKTELVDGKDSKTDSEEATKIRKGKDSKNVSAEKTEIRKDKYSESVPTKASCSIPFFSYWIDIEGGVRSCGFDSKAHIGNAISENSRELQKRRKEFCKLALAGECSRELCTMNMESSTIL
ncbi:hypothetical protein FACS1894111_04110 [Clostridia bacterium]|nr:hypothetical protein FACS1894111_04110 [Clostridia bacterium]